MKMEKSPNKGNKKGFLLIESALSIAIMSFITVSAMMFLLNSLFESASLSLHRQAVFITSTMIEKTAAYKSLQSFYFPGFEATSSIRSISPCLMEITATTTWKGQGVHDFSLSMIQANMLESQRRGGDCGGYFDAPIKALSPSKNRALDSFSLRKIDILDQQAFVAGSSTGSSNLLMLDFRSPQLNAYVSGPVAPINALDAIHGYVFTANEGSSSQVSVFSVDSPGSPVLISTSSLPGVAGSFPSGLSIRYYANRLYVGTHRTAGREFHIYDVSDPNYPKWLGSIELDHNINDILICGDFAYLATSGNTSDIIILNISDPKHILKIASITFSGPEDTLRLFLLGTTLYAGRKKGTSANHPEVVLVDVQDPYHPQVIGTDSLGASVSAIAAFGQEAIVGTNNGIYLLDTGNLAHITSKILDSLPSAGVDQENSTLYSINGSSLASFTMQ
jgi:hypothetical protein